MTLMCTHLSLFCFPNTSTCCHWCQPEFDKIWLGPSANIFYPYKDLDIKFPMSEHLFHSQNCEGFRVQDVALLYPWSTFKYFLCFLATKSFCILVCFIFLFILLDWNKTNLGGKKDNLENTSNNMQNLHPSHITNITIWKRQLLHLQSEASSDLL